MRLSNPIYLIKKLNHLNSIHTAQTVYEILIKDDTTENFRIHISEHFIYHLVFETK